MRKRSLYERFDRTMTLVPLYGYIPAPLCDVAHVSAMGTTVVRIRAWGK